MRAFRNVTGYSVVLSLAGLATAACSAKAPGTTPNPAVDGVDAGEDATPTTELDDDISVPSSSGMGGAASCGATLGTYRNVTVFSNGADTRANLCSQQSQCEGGYKSAYGASLVCAAKSGASQCGTGRDLRLRTEYGLAYQCIEYVRRFLGQRYHGGTSGGVPCLGNGNAIDLWKTASPYFRAKYRNGEATTPPQPDDIVVFYDVAKGTADAIGHVAVVRRVAADRIWVAQQNVTGTQLDANYPLDVSTGNGNTVTLTDAGGALTGYAIAGWVRNPDNDPFSCGSDQTCPDDYSCVNGKCGACIPESTAAFCSRQGKTCGNASGTDNCGSTRSVNCGACTCQNDCNGHGTCNGSTGNCTCTTGYALPACGTCDTGYSGYPNCAQTVSCPASCSGHGTCSAQTGICSCATGYAGSACDSCDNGYSGYPSCAPSSCSGASSQPCGKCGTQTRTCTSGNWSNWSTCSGEGACTPTNTQSCGSGGTQTCGSDCTWGACGGQSCSGTAPTQACGKCGSQTATCDGTTGQWNGWGACQNEGACSPTATQACGNNGTQTCANDCTWGTCTGQSCSGSGSQACTNCGTQTRTCNNGTWGQWGACTGQGTCAVGSQQTCGGPFIQTCSVTCAWSTCGAWANWKMPNSPSLALPNPASYTDNGNGTVTDNVTGLVWEKNVNSSNFSWADAKAYCAGLPTAGGGWRLPSRMELVSIVDLTKSNPAIDTTAFPNTPSQAFWSASAWAGSSSGAWNVLFYDGTTGFGYDVSTKLWVRCVR